MYSVTKTVMISAAHFLPEHEGKCKNMHGHNFKIIVTISRMGVWNGATSEQGMITDFGLIKDVIMKLDHCILNDIIQNPTAENIATWIAAKLSHCSQVIVEETPGNVACYTP